MERLIYIHKDFDDFGVDHDLIIPLEYKSKKDFIKDITEEILKWRGLTHHQRASLPGEDNYTIKIGKYNLIKHSVNVDELVVYTLAEWFESNKE